jgi:hypothetical protein
MSDTLSAARVEPFLDQHPAPAADVVHRTSGPELVVPDEPRSGQPLQASAPTQTFDRSATSMGGSHVEQLARIEDKAARIEEKYARSEALMQRVADKVEVATARMSEVALGSDLAALRGEVAAVSRRVSSVPGAGTMFFMALLTAVLAAAATALILRYGIPGLLPPR